MRIEDMSLAERVAHYVKMRFKATRRRTGRYDGAELCAIRKLKGVGRPIKKSMTHRRLQQDRHTNDMALKAACYRWKGITDPAHSLGITDRRKFIFAPPGREMIIGTAWLRKGSRYG